MGHRGGPCPLVRYSPLEGPNAGRRAPVPFIQGSVPGYGRQRRDRRPGQRRGACDVSWPGGRSGPGRRRPGRPGPNRQGPSQGRAGSAIRLDQPQRVSLGLRGGQRPETEEGDADLQPESRGQQEAQDKVLQPRAEAREDQVRYGSARRHPVGYRRVGRALNSLVERCGEPRCRHAKSRWSRRTTRATIVYRPTGRAGRSQLGHRGASWRQS